MLAPAAANILLFTAILGFGGALRRVTPRVSPGWERAAFTVVAGTGVTGTLLFLVGLIWFTPAAIAAILVAGTVLAVAQAASLVRRSSRATPFNTPPLLPAAIVGGVLLITAIGGLAAPTGSIRSDAIAYHFLGPKVWAREGVIRPVPDESHTAFPAIVETQYGALMALGGESAPELFSVVGLVSILLVTAAVARRSGLDDAGAWWSAALVAAMPIVHRGVYGGFVDAVYSALIVAALWVGFDSERNADAAVFGLLCGFAIGTKYTGVIAGALLIAVSFVVIVVSRRRTIRGALAHAAIAAAVAAAVASPWYIRNWVVLGSPIYPPPPVVSDWITVRYMSPAAIRDFQAYVMHVNGMGRDIWNFVLLPFNLTFHPANFLNGDGGIGLTPLALAPLGLLARRRDWFAAALGIFVLLQTIAWFVTEQDARFLIHLWVIMAVLAIWGWRYVVQTHARAAAILAALLVATSVSYGLFLIAAMRKDDVRAGTSPAFAARRALLEIPYRDSFAYLNSDASVTNVLVAQPRFPTFYLDKPYLKPVGRWGEQSGAADTRRVSHVVDVRIDGGPFALAHPSADLTLVLERDDQRVYRVQTAGVK